jgi:propanediol dehydratase small subunit
VGFDPRSDYPIGAKRPELVRTATGIALEELTLDGLRNGRLDADDVRAAPDTLRRQSAVALAAGRPQLAENLARAAELAAVPAETILEIYTALRPGRSTAARLEEWAERLESAYAAPLTAALVRDARAAYAERKLLATGERAAV